jgi:hypothetical protein
MKTVPFGIKVVPAGTGSAVWDTPHACKLIQRFMPYCMGQEPSIGIVDLDWLRPTPAVLRDVVITVGQDAKAGKYGSCSVFISTKDEATRAVIIDIASQQNFAVFVSSSPVALQDAQPAGALTAKDRETMNLVLEVGGTVTATEFARSQGIEQTAAGNRLVSLHKKGYLQRIERPHPTGDLFIDPRSVKPVLERQSS